MLAEIEGAEADVFRTADQLGLVVIVSSPNTEQEFWTGLTGRLAERTNLAGWYLLHRPEVARHLGREAREFVRRHFLMTRNLRDYLTLMLLCENPGRRVVEF